VIKLLGTAEAADTVAAEAAREVAEALVSGNGSEAWDVASASASSSGQLSSS
jgi:hypothetical protein